MMFFWSVRPWNGNHRSAAWPGPAGERVHVHLCGRVLTFLLTCLWVDMPVCVVQPCRTAGASFRVCSCILHQSFFKKNIIYPIFLYSSHLCHLKNTLPSMTYIGFLDLPSFFSLSKLTSPRPVLDALKKKQLETVSESVSWQIIFLKKTHDYGPRIRKLSVWTETVLSITVRLVASCQLSLGAASVCSVGSARRCLGLAREWDVGRDISRQLAPHSLTKIIPSYRRRGWSFCRVIFAW